MSDQSVRGRAGEEWYTCNRCGFNYPRSQVLVQLGQIVCRGANTCNCFDAPGRDYYQRRLQFDQEENPAPLPEVSEDI